MILVYGVFTLVCNLDADLAYGWLDPRVRPRMNRASRRH
jgi:ABC-type dipeptide/oligopeptide/nickel transport system permease component